MWQDMCAAAGAVPGVCPSFRSFNVIVNVSLLNLVEYQITILYGEGGMFY